MPLPHVVIVGGGFGGLSAAKALKHAPVQLTVIDRRNHHLFQPLLYQVATAGLSPADIAMPIRSILRRQSNTEVLMGEVTGVDTRRKLVLLEKRKMPFDYLILATGARHAYFGHQDWERFAPGIKSLEDAVKLRGKILLSFEKAEIEDNPALRESLLTFVIVGGGPTGVELAGAIAELSRKTMASDFSHIRPQDAKIILLEAAPKILGTFPEDLSRKAQKKLEDFGVQVMVNTKVERVNADGVIASGRSFPSKNVIWAAGVLPSAAAQWLKAPTDRLGRVQVEKDLSVPGHPEIFVIGDTACFLQDGAPLPGLAPVAMQEGRYAAHAIIQRIGGRQIRPFRYRDKGNLATVGRSFAIADLKKIHLSGFPAWVAWLVVHIYYLIGFRNRLFVLIQWAWAYLTFQRGARIITNTHEL